MGISLKIIIISSEDILFLYLSAQRLVSLIVDVSLMNTGVTSTNKQTNITNITNAVVTRVLLHQESIKCISKLSGSKIEMAAKQKKTNEQKLNNYGKIIFNI